MVVHPEVGKWLIALGEKAFGMDPFGWRIAAAVVGALMVLVMCRLARRLTGSTVLGCVAGLLLSFDGLHFVLSRLALLDIFLAFFLLCGVLASSTTATHPPRLAALAGATAPDQRRVLGPELGAGPRAARSGRGWWWAACASGWRSAPSGRRSTRWRRSACWSSSGARRAPEASACGGPGLRPRSPTAYRRSSSWSSSPVRLRRHLDRLARARRRLRGGLLVAVPRVQRRGPLREDDDSYVATDLDEASEWPTAKEPDAERAR